MKTRLRRLRGALSLGFLGSFAGAVIAAVWEVASTLLGGGSINPESVVFWTLLGASVGGASGLGFSALVTTLGANTTLQGLSVGKAGLWGGVAGAVASSLVSYSLTGALLPALQGALPFIAFCTGVGVAIGGGVVRIAQASVVREVSSAGGHQDLIGDGRNEDAG